MKMAELSRRSGLSVPTIKYYLREGLLEPGHRTGINQAAYDDSHLDRLRLIRALSKVAGLPLAKIHEIIDVLDSDSSIEEALALTQDALVQKAGPVPEGSADEVSADPESQALLEKLIEARGWPHDPSSPAHQAAAQALSELRAEGLDSVLDRVDEYSALADEIARLDLDAIARADDPEDTVRLVVLGSTLRRPLLDALILIAQQKASIRTFGGGPGN